MLHFFIRRPKFAIVIALVITLVGIVSLKVIPVEQYPDITPPVVAVSALYPGASARDVAQAVASPIEAQVNGVSNMLYMESTSANNGGYQLSITFASGTDPDMAAVEVQNRISQVSAQLPAEVNNNGVSVRKRASNLLLGVSVFSPKGSRDTLFLSNYTSIQLRDALARISGVGDVQVFGARDYSMRVWLESAAYGVARYQRAGHRAGVAAAERAGRSRPDRFRAFALPAAANLDHQRAGAFNRSAGVRQSDYP